jgi:hypothetical protein
MRAPVVIKADPICDHTTGVLQCLEAVLIVVSFNVNT